MLLIVNSVFLISVQKYTTALIFGIKLAVLYVFLITLT